MSEKVSVLAIAIKTTGGEKEWDRLSDDRKHERLEIARDAIAAMGFTPYVPGWFLPESDCSDLAKSSFADFLKLVRHGAKAIDIRVRKDGKEFTFQADILKYVRKI